MMPRFGTRKEDPDRNYRLCRKGPVWLNKGGFQRLTLRRGIKGNQTYIDFSTGRRIRCAGCETPVA